MGVYYSIKIVITLQTTNLIYRFNKSIAAKNTEAEYLQTYKVRLFYF